MKSKNIFLALTLLSLLALPLNAQETSDAGNVYGDNLLTISPFSGYTSEQVGDVMVGISYERFLNGFVSLKVPVRLGLVNNGLQGALIAKFYTSGHDAQIRYSIGPSLIFTHARTEDLYYTYELDPFGQAYYEETDVNQFGFMLVNSLNITIQKSIYLGVDMGLGLNYLNQTKLKGGDMVDEDPGVNFNFDISMGYRF